MSSSTTEIEYKFDIPRASLSAIEAALSGPDCRRTRLQARYFDTAQSDLARRGVALRLRKEGPRWVQTAKALGDGPVQRLEHNVDLGPARKSQALQAQPERHANTPVGAVLDEVLQQASAPLVEVYGTDIWRCTREVQQGSSRIEIALDQGRMVAPSADGDAPLSAVVCELEFELLDGDVRDLASLAGAWVAQHGLTLSTVTKSERGLRLAHGQSTPPATHASAPRWPRRADVPDGATVQRVLIASCLEHILPNASEIASGSQDAEHVHQLRIGLRRLRTALRALAPLGPGLDPAWQAPLAQASRVLGAWRDQQLVLTRLQPRLQAAGAPAIALPAPTSAAEAAIAAVRESSFQRALVELIGFAAAAGAQGLAASATRQLLARQLRTLYRQVRQDGRQFEALPPAARHRLRKRLKRLRYLAEFVGPCFGAKRSARFTRALLPALDALGDHMDEVEALAIYRSAVAADAQAWFAVGWLQAQAPHSAQQCQHALRALGRDAQPFWRKNKR
jgi:triphosphatase